jgi:hypothetical protein
MKILQDHVKCGGEDVAIPSTGQTLAWWYQKPFK